MGESGTENQQPQSQDRRQFTRREGDIPRDDVLYDRIKGIVAQIQTGNVNAEEATHNIYKMVGEKKIYDELTGACSRVEILRILNREVDESISIPDHKLGALFLDADHFKAINDEEKRHHEAGNDTLIEMVKICTEVIGHMGEIGRMSGEEFLVVLHGKSYQELIEVAQKIGGSLESDLARRANLDRPKVTVSGGLAFFSPGKLPLDLVSKADELMYKAKEGGRNQMAVEGKEGFVKYS